MIRPPRMDPSFTENAIGIVLVGILLGVPLVVGILRLWTWLT